MHRSSPYRRPEQALRRFPDGILYRVVGFSSGNVTLLKDAAFAEDKVPRTLLVTGQTAVKDQTGEHFERAALQYWDELLVTAARPFSVRNKLFWNEDNAQLTVNGSSLLSVQGEAMSAKLRKRGETVSVVTFIYKAAQQGQGGDVRIIDPMFNRLLYVGSSKIDKRVWAVPGGNPTGLPVKVTFARLPKNTVTYERSSLFLPAENEPWLDTQLVLERKKTSLEILLTVCPVEMGRNRSYAEFPLFNVPRLVCPYLADFEKMNLEDAIRDHEQALAAAVASTAFYQREKLKDCALLLDRIDWSEEVLDIVGEYVCVFDMSVDAEKEALANLARRYTAGTAVRIQKMKLDEATMPQTEAITADASPNQENQLRYAPDGAVAAEARITDMYAAEDGNFRLQFRADSEHLLISLGFTELWQLRDGTFQMRITNSDFVSRGFTCKLAQGTATEICSTDWTSTEDLHARAKARQADTLRAWFGGGSYDPERATPEDQMKLIRGQTEVSEAQRRAITAIFDGHHMVAIRAAAGTGKTTLIATATKVHHASALIKQLDYQEAANKYNVHQRYDPETEHVDMPSPPPYAPWVITSVANAAVKNLIVSCRKKCGSQFKFLVFMSKSALKKCGGDVPWMENLVPVKINRMCQDMEQHSLTQNERKVMAKALDICAARFADLPGINWTQIASEERSEEDDSVVMRQAITILINRERYDAFFGTAASIMRNIDTLGPFIKAAIIDEGSTTPEIAPLAFLVQSFCLQKVVLVGDDKQLAVFEGNLPMAGRKLAYRSALDTLLERWDKNSNEAESNMAVLRLWETYRMHPALGAFASELSYSQEDGNGLVTKVRASDRALLTASRFPLPREEMPIVAIDVAGKEAKNLLNSSLIKEHTPVVKLIVTLLTKLIPGASIGVVCFYNGMRDELRAEELPIPTQDILSVDTAQGLEYDITIVLPSRSVMRENEGFLDDPRRLCVAFTRSRSGTIVVADFKALDASEAWKRTTQLIADRTPIVGTDYVGHLEQLLANVCQYEQGPVLPTKNPNRPSDRQVYPDSDDDVDVMDIPLPDGEPPASAIYPQMSDDVAMDTAQAAVKPPGQVRLNYSEGRCLQDGMTVDARLKALHMQHQQSNNAEAGQPRADGSVPSEHAPPTQDVNGTTTIKEVITVDDSDSEREPERSRNFFHKHFPGDVADKLDDWSKEDEEAADKEIHREYEREFGNDTVATPTGSENSTQGRHVQDGEDHAMDTSTMDTSESQPLAE